MECEKGTEPATWVFTQSQSNLAPTKRFSCDRHRKEVAESIQAAQNSSALGPFHLKFDFRREVSSASGTDSAGMPYERDTPLWMLQNTAVEPIKWQAFVFVNIFEFVQRARDSGKWPMEEISRLESDAAHTKF